MFTLAGVLFNFGSVALHLAQDLFTLARALFNFGLVALHVAQDLFTLSGPTPGHSLVRGWTSWGLQTSNLRNPQS